VEFASFHTSGYKNINVPPGILKNMYTPLPVNNWSVTFIFVFQSLQQKILAEDSQH
jgi:hypothetical protein